MPTFRHGKDAAVLWDEFDLSPFLNAASMSASMDPGEVTNFASEGNREYIKGLMDATLSLEGFYSVATTEPSTEITDVITSAFAGTTNPVITIGLEGDVIGRRAILASGVIPTYDIDAPVDDVITTSVDLQSNRGFEGGFWLRGVSTASTANGLTGTAVNSGLTNGGTTGGGVAHFHMTAMTSTSARLNVQHSTSGSTWATLISSTFLTEGVVRSTVSGTVKEQLRSLISNVSTAGVTGLTAAISFARYGPFKG